MRMNPGLAAFMALSASIATAPAFAQGAATYPSRPVTIVHPYPPGGSTEPEVRMYMERLTANLKVAFVLDIKPGAGTTIGTAIAAKAKPDGYTLVTLSPSFVTTPLTYKDRLPYDPIKDIAPVSLMSKRGSLIVVHTSLPINSVKDYVAYVKANPGKFNFGVSGAGGITHMGIEWFMDATNTSKNATVVPYKGGGPMYVDLVAGRLHGAVASALTMVPHIEAGKLRAIAQSSNQRMKLFPDLPTADEQGATGYDYSFWVGFAAPAGTPSALINKMSAELAKVARDPEIVKKLVSQANNAIGSTPEQFGQHIRSELARWKKVVEDTGMQLPSV